MASPVPRYQVFISSTYLDLKVERQEVLHALLDLDCIPSGMELFAASSDEQFNLIVKEIDLCDYYVLLIGNRYGSIHSDGTSYTQREFEYACKRGLPILVFLPADGVGSPPTEDAAALAQLAGFRAIALGGRTGRYWKSAADLANQVVRALGNEIRDNPRVGWIRADAGPSATTLAEMNSLLAENRNLTSRVSRLEGMLPGSGIPDLAPLQQEFTFTCFTRQRVVAGATPWLPISATRTFATIFGLIGPAIIGPVEESKVGASLARSVSPPRPESSEFALPQAELETLRLQFEAHGLIDTAAAPVIAAKLGVEARVHWRISAVGRQALLGIRTVKAPPPTAPH